MPEKTAVKKPSAPKPKGKRGKAVGYVRTTISVVENTKTAEGWKTTFSGSVCLKDKKAQDIYNKIRADFGVKA